MKMNDLENTDKFKKAEKRLSGLEQKLEKRIKRTEEATIEAKKIGKELKKIRKEKNANH